jgi:hypothetical protein
MLLTQATRCRPICSKVGGRRESGKSGEILRITLTTPVREINVMIHAIFGIAQIE